MAERKWQDTGSIANIQPEDAVQDCNIIPNPDTPGSGKNSVGTAQNPWHGLVIRTANLFASIYAWFSEDRTLFGFDAIPSITIIKARTAMQQHDDESDLAVLQLDQQAPTGPVLYIDANEDNDQTATISKVNGSGAVDGPKKKFGMDTYGWKFANKMEKVNLNGTIYYRPLFLPDVEEE